MVGGTEKMFDFQTTRSTKRQFPGFIYEHLIAKASTSITEYLNTLTTNVPII